MDVVVTVMGQDRVGIVAAVAQTLADHHVNIVDMTQTILHGSFTMMMGAKLPADADFATVKQAVQVTGEQLGMTIQMQRHEIFDAMHEV
ncbi:ACT domain-containing protein [Lacticaseibacillus pantheris]|jgi:ACT domain-containing protein|uniref:ACT domain-containing protein n=1 Tax=Lacticaseibacillus pantheris TaxID=171523 RepID=UPI0025982AC3|nr:ACT domain-containing protein [Lacticaseibacillus pantheris]WKF85033.1 ACT domain-containing protein [Lacticaseibacillus pantheris]